MMPEPTDDDVSLLVDIARSAGTMLSDAKQARLPDLVAAGLIAPAASGASEGQRYKLTASGQAILDARGVGANES